jgi:hypothetical protein
LNIGSDDKFGAVFEYPPNTVAYADAAAPVPVLSVFSAVVPRVANPLAFDAVGKAVDALAPPNTDDAERFVDADELGFRL